MITLAPCNDFGTHLLQHYVELFSEYQTVLQLPVLAPCQLSLLQWLLSVSLQYRPVFSVLDPFYKAIDATDLDECFSNCSNDM